MSSLHDTVTWYKKTTLLNGKRRRGQEKQRDNLIKKAHILSFQGPPRYSEFHPITSETLLLSQLLRGENDSKQSDEFQATTASSAIQQGDFCTMWQSRVKGPFQRSHSIARSVFGGKTATLILLADLKAKVRFALDIPGKSQLELLDFANWHSNDCL